jgi:hypothetical protein
MTRVVKSEGDIPALTAVKVSNGIARPLFPCSDTPLIDGVSLSASADGKVQIAGAYGAFTAPGADWKVGHLYVGEGGLLTQDFSAAAATGWVVCVGWATSQTEFRYAPHAPMRYPQPPAK